MIKRILLGLGGTPFTDVAIEKFKEKCAESDILTKTERETGDPFESMIAHARYNDVTIYGHDCNGQQYPKSNLPTSSR